MCLCVCVVGAEANRISFLPLPPKCVSTQSSVGGAEAEAAAHYGLFSTGFWMDWTPAEAGCTRYWMLIGRGSSHTAAAAAELAVSSSVPAVYFKRLPVYIKQFFRGKTERSFKVKHI